MEVGLLEGEVPRQLPYSYSLGAGQAPGAGAIQGVLSHPPMGFLHLDNQQVQPGMPTMNPPLGKS